VVCGCGGAAVSIVQYLEKSYPHDTIITDYIDHIEFYVGHFIVNNGTILDSIYFVENTNGVKNFILRQLIKPNIILERNELKEQCEDVLIFDNIFKTTSYSGFACADFVIKNNKIIIFEINPRAGGSLISHPQYCNRFFNKMNYDSNDQINKFLN
jgi:predicted ATP-grasp superfamily ATP-dependent carboligase